MEGEALRLDGSLPAGALVLCEPQVLLPRAGRDVDDGSQRPGEHALDDTLGAAEPEGGADALLGHRVDVLDDGGTSRAVVDEWVDVVVDELVEQHG